MTQLLFDQVGVSHIQILAEGTRSNRHAMSLLPGSSEWRIRYTVAPNAQICFKVTPPATISGERVWAPFVRLVFSTARLLDGAAVLGEEKSETSRLAPEYRQVLTSLNQSGNRIGGFSNLESYRGLVARMCDHF